MAEQYDGAGAIGDFGALRELVAEAEQPDAFQPLISHARHAADDERRRLGTAAQCLSMTLERIRQDTILGRGSRWRVDGEPMERPPHCAKCAASGD